MATVEPDGVPPKGDEAEQESMTRRAEQSVPASFEIWRGSCLERICGPNPTMEEQQNWYRWCQYHCTEHAICKRKDPPGPY